MEKINNIKIKNFKSLRNVEINDCRRVNVFVGYPNVGKSNILEALGLYGLYKPHQYANSKKYNKSEIINLKDLCRVWKQSELFYNQEIRSGIDIILNDNFLMHLHTSEENLKGTYTYLKDNDSKYSISELRLISEGYNFFINQNFKIDFENLNDFFDGQDIPDYYPLINVKKYEFSDLKEFQRNSNSNQQSLNIPYGNNLLEIIQGYPEIRQELNILFSEYNLRFAIENSSNSILLLKEMGNDTVVIIPYHQIADTLRRLIFFKAAVHSNNNSVLLFEEPEAHMFPPYISKLTSDVTQDKNNNQFFISTHSPFVLNDFMEDLDKEELAIYAVGYKQETGETVVHRMTGEEMEEIYQYGIDLFFNLENYLKDAV